METIDAAFKTTRLDIYMVWSVLAENSTNNPDRFCMCDLLVIEVFRKKILVEYKQIGLLRCRNGPITSRIFKEMYVYVIAANNHYAGFGPGTANISRNMLGLSDAK
ncbi:hypothetical protein [Nitrososphaera sp. AFS]|uniref:hypothetical protein n=1 Tax=Nitrososphaera sp. AFS TaxID=2301191 RepID=UPI0013923B44|nr:hypothetical protein [Nitrososphaera sp. AFS]NAL78601.1 hypothetical protein [Nitrososphaera sp. AFS]